MGEPGSPGLPHPGPLPEGEGEGSVLGLDASTLPSGTCDAHVHVFGPQSRFPSLGDQTFTPADAPKEALFALHARLGIERCVIVQSGAHGFGNRVAADAPAAKAGAYRGVALVRPDVPDAALHAIDAQGFRGVRFNYMGHLGQHVPPDQVLALGLGAHLAGLGWRGAVTGAFSKGRSETTYPHCPASHHLSRLARPVTGMACGRASPLSFSPLRKPAEVCLAPSP